MVLTPKFEQNSPPPLKQKKDSYGWFLLLLTLSLVIIALWLPFGFGLTALLEEWGVLGSYTTHGLFFIVDPSSPSRWAIHASRPLTVFSHAFAYYLDANSFDYWHALSILCLLIKGFAFGYLIKQITHSFQWALLAGILVIVYPADTMQMALRGLHINLALSLVLLASCFFIKGSEIKQSLISYLIFCTLAAGLMFAAINMYEAAIPLLLFPFLIIYIKEGFQSSCQHLWGRKILVISWIASLLVYLLYLHSINSKINTYQTNLIGGRGFWEFLIQTPFSKLFSVGALRALLGGWVDAFGMFFKEFGAYGYLYLFLIVSSIYSFVLLAKSVSQKNSEDINFRIRELLRLGMAGFVLLLAGYSPFLLLPSHMATTQRTFLFASPGAAMVWLAFLMLIAYRARKTALLLGFILVLVGSAAQLHQFHHYSQISTTQRTLLKAIVENFDGEPKDKTLLIIDKTNQLNYVWMLLIPNLQGALSYFYNHQINPIMVCRYPGNSWQLYAAKPGTCIEQENSWSFLSAKENEDKETQPEKTLLKKDLVVLTIEPDGKVIADPALEGYRHNLYQGQNETSLRFRNILTEKTWLSHFSWIWKRPASDRFQWSFGNWWGLENPIPGNGWQEAEWLVNNFQHKALSWKIAKEANLQFSLIPSADFYQLRIRLVNIVNERVRNSLQIRINDHEVPFRWLDPKFETDIPSSIELIATVPRKDLFSGINSIVFRSDTVKEYYGLSFQLASIKLLPKSLNSLNSDKDKT